MRMLHGVSKITLKSVGLGIFLLMIGCKTAPATSDAKSGFKPASEELSTSGNSVKIFAAGADPNSTFRSDLVIGIQANPDGNGGGDLSGHYYVVLGQKRIDGDIMKSPIIKDRSFSEGYFIIFRLTPAQFQAANAKFNTIDTKRTLTCVHAALKIVQTLTGYTLPKPQNQPYPNSLPGETFTVYLDQGFIDTSGKPVTTHLYRSKDLPLSKFQEILARREPEAKAMFVAGRIDIKRFELSDSQTKQTIAEEDLTPVSCHDLH